MAMSKMDDLDDMDTAIEFVKLDRKFTKNWDSLDAEGRAQVEAVRVAGVTARKSKEKATDLDRVLSDMVIEMETLAQAHSTATGDNITIFQGQMLQLKKKLEVSTALYEEMVVQKERDRAVVEGLSTDYKEMKAAKEHALALAIREQMKKKSTNRNARITAAAGKVSRAGASGWGQNWFGRGAAGAEVIFDGPTGVEHHTVDIAINWTTQNMLDHLREKFTFVEAIIEIIEAEFIQDDEIVRDQPQVVEHVLDLNPLGPDDPLFFTPFAPKPTANLVELVHIGKMRLTKLSHPAGVPVAAPLITPADVAEPALEPVSAGPDVPDVLEAVDGTALGEMSIDELLFMDAQGAIEIAKEKLELSQKQGELLKKEAQNYQQKAEMFKAACETLEARKQD